MRLLIFVLMFVLLTPVLLSSQLSENRPKLVVGIVVDQMRFDYLHRYRDRFGEDGFKRLMKDGYEYKNTHYNYIPTVTAAGHSSIYTGATPSAHGIVGNSWYDRELGRGIENIRDTSVHIVGSQRQNIFGVSPHFLKTTTITDELKLGTNFRSKVISISLKDRGAVFPGGHTADAAYWYDLRSSPGYFVTSSYYMDAVPQWVNDFNASGLASTYLDTIWEPLYPIESYRQSETDNNSHEVVLRTKEYPVFPYNYKQMRLVYRGLKNEYELLRASPFGNTYVMDFVETAIENENLGKDDMTDFLAVSFSTPDIIGHAFGPYSVEIEDIYLRLDLEIARLLKLLDAQIGHGEYTLFLSSDHGVAPVASFLQDKKLPVGIIDIPAYESALKTFMRSRFGKGEWVLEFGGENLYLDRALIQKEKLDMTTVQEDVSLFLMGLDGIKKAMPGVYLQLQDYQDGLEKRLQNGYHQKRSGDVMIIYEPGYYQPYRSVNAISEIRGTGHGTGYTYDTHVPLIWYGKNIPAGRSVRAVAITDIVPSIAMMLNLQFPNACSGEPLNELFE